METYVTKISLKLHDIIRETFYNKTQKQDLIPQKALPVQSPTSEQNFGLDVSLKEPFDYVCQISIVKKELGLNENLLGMTGLCICDTKISIINYPFKSKEQNSIDIMMPSIIGVGVEGTFFYIFLKDDSPLGYGQLWVETYDTKISVKLFDIIHETFENKKQDLKPQIPEPVTSPTSDHEYVDMTGSFKTPIKSDIKFDIVGIVFSFKELLSDSLEI
ncbi:unnamed protein product [Aphis gossypii]|uniref:Uncharacterized protein n=1 Tax=Aphis gossypii TaxID=80765 RepID=A0A9P0NLF4_APHGO|nr:unnamed protein product [Aphis gossypii]